MWAWSCRVSSSAWVEIITRLQRDGLGGAGDGPDCTTARFWLSRRGYTLPMPNGGGKGFGGRTSTDSMLGALTDLVDAVGCSPATAETAFAVTPDLDRQRSK